ncbi:MerR family transcriptional regulator [Abyssisolibacter fermentans]|uniref:MerR family transcriptional regulator n=1 Tax=Abyssisolibacter fermentans TaxID=1766203 RepID=UPI00082F41E3|nr:MerR family transcriptional regulator [Abyssisolibacter fermentans]
MIRIGEVSKTFNVSNRTLRYWEEKGILKSIRMENGYRYYDADSMRSIKQIVLLRKLKVPVQDIEYIFKSCELDIAIKVLSRHLENTKQEANTFKALSIVLEKLILLIRSGQDLSKALRYIDTSEGVVMAEFKNALQISLSERKSNMSEKNSYNEINNEVRIINLPKMIFACYRAESESPEDDCSKIVNKVIAQYSLDKKPGFRHFGFNNPSPSESSTVYGYEIWFVVPEDFEIPSPLWRKEFDGGLFAAIPTKMSIIGERWEQLYNWTNNNSKYASDWNPEKDRRCFEECIDFNTFMSSDIDFNEKQLDLLTPIKKID